MTESKPRHRRIEGEMQRALSELVSREVKDPRVGSVTITRSEDRGGHELGEGVLHAASRRRASRKTCSKASRARAGYLRGEVGRRLSLRHAPRLEFEFDDSFEKAAKLTALIDQGAEVATSDAHRDPVARQAPRAFVELRASAREATAARGEGRPRRQPRSARDRHAADLPGRGDQDRGRHPVGPQALSLHHRAGQSHGDGRRRRRDRRDAAGAGVRPCDAGCRC